MHMVIRAIVYAKTKAEALEKAKATLDQLSGDNGQPFDYYRTFDGPGTRVSGRGRYGNLTACELVTSPNGQALVEEGMQATCEEFQKNLTIIRAAVAGASDEQIREEQLPEIPEILPELRSMIRYYFNKVGEYQGSSIWLYSEEGEGIRSRAQLGDVLSMFRVLYDDQGKRNPHAEDLVWVVPADVHF